MILLLVRHSMPALDPAHPASDWPLSPEGRQRSRALAACLAVYRPRSVYSSPERKALETARLALPGQPARIEPALREHARAGLPFVARADFEAAVERFFAQPSSLVFGQETADQAHARFAGALRRIEAQAAPGPAAVFTHGTVLALYLARRRGADPLALWRSLQLPDVFVVAQA